MKNKTAKTQAAIVPEVSFVLEAPPAGGYIRKTELGIEFDAKTPLDIWTEEGRQLAQETKISAFRLADWFIFGETAYPKNYKAAIATTGLQYGTLRNMAVVARRFPAEKRVPELSFEHHRLLAPIKDDKKVEEIATKAKTEKLSAAAMRHVVPKVSKTPKAPGKMTEKQQDNLNARHLSAVQDALKYLADMPTRYLAGWKATAAEMVSIGEGIAAAPKHKPERKPSAKVASKTKK